MGELQYAALGGCLLMGTPAPPQPCNSTAGSLSTAGCIILMVLQAVAVNLSGADKFSADMVTVGALSCRCCSLAGLHQQAGHPSCPAWLHIPAATAAIRRRACPLQPCQNRNFNIRSRLDAAPWSATRALSSAGRLLIQCTSIAPCLEGLSGGSCICHPNPLLQAIRFC